MTQELAVRLSEAEARSLTDEVKADAAALWHKLLQLYEGEAHLALGYAAWGDYYAAEFGQSNVHGYRLLVAARTRDALEVSNPGVTDGATEKQLRELAPLKDDPPAMREAWEEASSNGEPTAEKVREVVQRKGESVEPPFVGPRTIAQQSKLVRGIAERARHIEELTPHLNLDAVPSLPEEERQEWKQQLSSARTALSRLIAAL